MRFLAQGSLHLKRALALVLAVQLVGCGGTSNSSSNQPPTGNGSTTTPIKHVIIVIGENHSFDNIFATYQPGDKTQHVWNLLSQQIVTPTGAPGANFAAAAQHQAMDNDIYRLSPAQTGPFATLPQPFFLRCVKRRYTTVRIVLQRCCACCPSPSAASQQNLSSPPTLLALSRLTLANRSEEHTSELQSLRHLV